MGTVYIYVQNPNVLGEIVPGVTVKLTRKSQVTGNPAPQYYTSSTGAIVLNNEPSCTSYSVDVTKVPGGYTVVNGTDSGISGCGVGFLTGGNFTLKLYVQVTKKPTHTLACDANSTCPSGQVCSNGQCVPAGTGGIGMPALDGIINFAKTNGKILTVVTGVTAVLAGTAVVAKKV